MDDNFKQYVVDFEGTRIPVSNLNIRRSRDTAAFCSVTVPEGDLYVDLFALFPTGTLIVSERDSNMTETVIGSYTLDQILTTESPSSQTAVLNCRSAFGADLTSSGLLFSFDAPITVSSNSVGNEMFSGSEEGQLVVDDVINLRGVNRTVESVALFVTTVNSRMDVGVS